MILNSKYPSPKPNKNSLLVAILWGLFVGGFLLFFQPFDIVLMEKYNKMIFVSFFGVITFLVLLLFLFFFPLILPNIFTDKKWTVGKHIAFFCVIFLTIATFNGLYINYANQLPFSWGNYQWIITRTFILGCIPMAFLIILNHNQRLKNNLRLSDEIQSLATSNRKNEESEVIHNIQLSTNSRTDLIESKFLYAKASGSYVIFFHESEHKIKEALHRVSLKSVLNQLPNKHIVQCHRSHIVNLNKVKRVSGNAQGLTLWLQNTNIKIPVSRNYVPEIKKRLSSL